MTNKKLTHEEIMELAKNMATPIRCGGTEYINGVLHYLLQGWLVPQDIVNQGWDAIKAYQDKHEPYTDLQERMKQRKIRKQINR
jgi:hypothetical protein